jgi:hypothetical protein
MPSGEFEYCVADVLLELTNDVCLTNYDQYPIMYELGFEEDVFRSMSVFDFIYRPE